MFLAANTPGSGLRCNMRWSTEMMYIKIVGIVNRRRSCLLKRDTLIIGILQLGVMALMALIGWLKWVRDGDKLLAVLVRFRLSTSKTDWQNREREASF